jgi:hypothetical protein
VNYSKDSADVSEAWIFKASRWHVASSILEEIEDCIDRHGMGFVDEVTYNPDSDPIYMITIKVERQ